MSLLARQTAFRAELVEPDDGQSPSSAGMAIYREAYRGRLLGALEVSFERTRRWVGEEPFTAAACHYILTRPPTAWTLDSYGADFPVLLADLFAGDPEVAELAWLEWHLQQAFAAPDRARLDPGTLAAAGYGEAEWAELGFAMAAGFALRPIQCNSAELWDSLAASDPVDGRLQAISGVPAGLAVWRDGLAPRYRVLDLVECQALERAAAGATLAEIATDAGGDRLGPWLAGWLAEGILSGVQLRP